MISSSDYADWKAPEDDGQVVIWPDGAELLRQTQANHAALSGAGVRIQGIGLSELRTRQRRAIGHADDEQFLITTGHQTELYHPGVWAKDVLIHTIAKRVSGRALHFAVDTDSPKHLHLRWPGGSLPISEDPRLATAEWSSLVKAPSRDHIRALQEALAEASAGWGYEPLLGRYLNLLAGSRGEGLLPPAIASACEILNCQLGLCHDMLLMSSVWHTEPYLVFAHHFLARAFDFGQQYNAALGDYRREQGIASPGRPMPDLQLNAPERVETPFWLDDLGAQTRRRLTLRWEHDRWCLEDFGFVADRPGEQGAEALARYLKERKLRIEPRALMLTMFFRLLLADQFVHGIGGGRYDQVTDRIIAAHFGMAPPKFSVTTATLYFPAAAGQKRVNLRPLLQEGRRLRHGSFWAPKREMASQIAVAPRHSVERRRLYFDMHALLARQAETPRMQEWSAQLEEATQLQSQQKTLFDRELFYAIQSEERLRRLISRYDEGLKATAAVIRGS